MLEIEPVSKYRKEAYTRMAKIKVRHKQKSAPFLHHPYSLEQLESTIRQIKEPPYHDRQFQDSHLTQFLHQQLTLIRLTLNLFGLTSILLSFMTSIVDLDSSRKQILALHTLITLIAVVLVFLKHCKTVQLKEKQLIRQKKENKYLKWLKVNWFESLFLLIHPNILTMNTVVQVSEPIYGMMTPFKLNHLLQILMLGRIYLLYVSFIETSIYCTPRANRMCRIYNAKSQSNFGIKSVFYAYPLYFLLVLFISLVLILSQMLRLAEENNDAFQNFGNAVWCIIVTMGTVGYGDIFPISYLGRAIAFCAAISGIIVSSLLILTLSEKLAMNSKEARSHITLERLQLRSVLQEYAQEVINYTSSMARGQGSRSQELKKKSQLVKLATRRLKNMVDTDNLSQEINNLFQTLYGNLMEIYIQQKQYADELVLLRDREKDRIEQINFTFAGQIQEIIRDR